MIIVLVSFFFFVFHKNKIKGTIHKSLTQSKMISFSPYLACVFKKKSSKYYIFCCCNILKNKIESRAVATQGQYRGSGQDHSDIGQIGHWTLDALNIMDIGQKV